MKHLLFRVAMRCYKSLFARRLFYPFNKLLFNASLRGLGVFVNEHENMRATGECRFLRGLASRWPASPVVFDVGAHIGEYSDLVKTLCPTAEVYAFEPHPQSFARLERQAREHGYVAINAGCGDRSGPMMLYDCEADQGSPLASMYPDVIDQYWKKRNASLAVDVVRLDDFIAERQISRVSLLKIDTEGHELNVLGGLERAIAQNLIDMIHFEFNASKGCHE